MYWLSPAWWLIAPLTMVWLAGCQAGSAPPGVGAEPEGGAVSATQPTPGDYWRPRPTDVRIYPATRFITRGGEPTLDASIELLDAMGDSIKAPGRLRCELLAVGDRGQIGGRLYDWLITLRTRAQQRQYFDMVTRAYVLRLALDSAEVVDRSTLLRVTFTTPSGRRLGAERRLPIQW